LKKTALHTITLLVILSIFFSCSTRKDRFLNRALHTTTTKYNVLYNGNLAFDEAKKELDNSYEDNFYTVLPIEPLKIDIKKSIELPPKSPKSIPKSKKNSSNSTLSTATGFARAEEKAVKAVQKHAMNIGGKEKNKQIDDAYFLLGKARYFDQRFIPALETFKYIIKHYPKSPLFSEARIWEAKCLTRLRNEDEAIYKLNLLLEIKDTPDQIKNDALTALAMAYTAQDSTQMVINLLDSTLQYKTKNHIQKARNLYILGQLYRKENKIDSSNMAFNKLSQFKKAPYRFKIHSQLERASNYNKEVDSTQSMAKNLEKSIKNRDNRPYLDEIYYRLAKINLANNQDKKAICRLKKSLRTKITHTPLQSLAYEDLGNINFDNAKFLNAGAYYDSVLDLADNKNTKHIRRLTRKRKSLDKVIALENISTRNDSILNLSAMSKENQTAYFEKIIKELKKKDEEAKIIAQNSNLNNTGNSFINPSSKQSASGGKFYFYNAQTVGFGQSSFKKIWGNRKLADNWRISEKNTTNQDDKTTEDEEETEEITADKKYDIEYYLAQIPTDKNVIDSISNQRNDAYYKLGLIYKEKFKKDKLATTKLEKLLNFSPDENLILPTYYHLYKAFESFDMTKSNYYKGKITATYPESRYAQIINNPDFIAENDSDENSPEGNYKKTYAKYLDKKYKTTLNDCELYIIKYSNTDIIPKFELLKAYAIAKTKGREEFITALKFVATNYPDLEEGIHAKRVLASLNGETIATKKNNADKKKSLKKRIKEKKKKKNILKKGGKKDLPSDKKMLERIKNKNKQPKK